MLEVLQCSKMLPRLCPSTHLLAPGTQCHQGHLLSWDISLFTELRSASLTSCTKVMSYSTRICRNKLGAAHPWLGAAHVVTVGDRET